MKITNDYPEDTNYFGEEKKSSQNDIHCRFIIKDSKQEYTYCTVWQNEPLRCLDDEKPLALIVVFCCQRI